MRKNIAAALALSLVLSACGNENTATNNTTAEAEVVETNENEEVSETNEPDLAKEASEEKEADTAEVADQKNSEERVIYTSFYPIYNLTKQIAGDKFEVKSFANLKTESHGWEPAAKDIADLTGAELLIINGAGMEEWEENVEGTVDVEILDTSKDLDLMTSLHGHEHGDEDHDHEEEMEEAHDHEEDGHEHSHGEYDPHTWLSPINAKAQAKVIAAKLSEIDPANEAYYTENYKTIADELDAMTEEYKEKFEALDTNYFLVNHAAFGYLAHDFGLNQVALTGLTSIGEASASDIKELVDMAADLGVDTIFYERGGSDKTVKTVADEMGAKVDSLNTMEYATDEDLANDVTYQELMRENLEKLYQSMAK